ncbi:LSM domain-containing protein [Aspergillus vadensis CBS 113365]|uniref:U6 snRNA-associated Sm-like protein LSm6 n=1 Tax=Aspergillus vadensis (strain CBS 113365 / IMI 142717 / IBT 24658) TaxID=1448311 RepID=A0A319B1Q4_ASPVC|nr:hypothetical protein BO88DRAFT_445603 [Aspergillus vadensis CBS 113365]PYH66389.1 hypothetical protein BO88DRAFT_445603 [Aspergillus vadensis CBS 113365]
MDGNQAVQYLDSLIGRTLRVHATDTRIFVGTFKCTDAARNIILASTYEYRFPSPSTVRDAATGTHDSAAGSAVDAQSVKMDMTSRFIGLVNETGGTPLLYNPVYQLLHRSAPAFSYLGLGAGGHRVTNDGHRGGTEIDWTNAPISAESKRRTLHIHLRSNPFQCHTCHGWKPLPASARLQRRPRHITQNMPTTTRGGLAAEAMIMTRLSWGWRWKWRPTNSLMELSGVLGASERLTVR